MNLGQFLKTRWRWLLLILAPLILLAMTPLLPMQDWVKSLAGLAERSGVWGALLFILANAIAITLMVPGWVFTITAGLMYLVVTYGVLWAFRAVEHRLSGHLRQREDPGEAVRAALRLQA